jgi:hypothetical protein
MPMEFTPHLTQSAIRLTAPLPSTLKIVSSYELKDPSEKIDSAFLAFNLLVRGGGKCSMPMLPGSGVSPQIFLPKYSPSREGVRGWWTLNLLTYSLLFNRNDKNS